MSHTQPRHTKGVKSNIIPENFQTLHNPISERMQGHGTKAQDKKHLRANSSINNYASHQLQQQLQNQHQLATLQMGNFVPMAGGVT